MSDVVFPGGLSELEFVAQYHASALRKPQVVADAALRTFVYAPPADRAVLAAVIAEQAAEAARRLCAVHAALSDRRYSIARSLLRPLPGAEAWRQFAQQAGVYSPEEMLRELSLGEGALESARKLRSQPDLAALSHLVAAAEAGMGMVLVPGIESPRGPEDAWFAGVDREGTPVANAVALGEGDAAGLADIAADLASIARGFLGAYLGARRTAGRRE